MLALPLVLALLPLTAAASRFTSRLTSVRVEYADGLGMTLGPGDGDLTWGDTNANFRERTPVYDRGSHDGFVEGKDLVVPFSITVHQKNEALTSAVAARVRDFFHKAGYFASAASVDDTIPDCFKMIVTYEDAGTTTTETWPKCVGGFSRKEGSPFNTFAISGDCHQAPTVT